MESCYKEYDMKNMKLDKNGQRIVSVTVWMSAEVMEAYVEVARRERRSRNSAIALALEEHASEHGLLNHKEAVNA